MAGVPSRWVMCQGHLKGRSSGVQAQVGASVEGRCDVSLQQLLWHWPAEEDRAWNLQTHVTQKNKHRWTSDQKKVHSKKLLQNLRTTRQVQVLMDHDITKDVQAALSRQTSKPVGSAPGFPCRWCSWPAPVDDPIVSEAAAEQTGVVGKPLDKERTCGSVR